MYKYMMYRETKYNIYSTLVTIVFYNPKVTLCIYVFMYNVVQEYYSYLCIYVFISYIGLNRTLLLVTRNIQEIYLQLPMYYLKSYYQLPVTYVDL